MDVEEMESGKWKETESDKEGIWRYTGEIEDKLRGLRALEHVRVYLFSYECIHGSLWFFFVGWNKFGSGDRCVLLRFEACVYVFMYARYWILCSIGAMHAMDLRW